MGAFKNYDPGRIIVTLMGAQLQGYADGTFVKAARTTETFKSSAGAGGDVVRIRSRDKRGTVVVTIQAASTTNDILSTFAASDERTGTTYGPLLIKDLNGTTIIEAANAWVVKPADAEYGTDSPNREWTIECAELSIFDGGAVV